MADFVPIHFNHMPKIVIGPDGPHIRGLESPEPCMLVPIDTDTAIEHQPKCPLNLGFMEDHTSLFILPQFEAVDELPEFGLYIAYLGD